MLEQKNTKISISTIFCCRSIYWFAGKLVDLEDTIKGFDAICKGEYDHLPEAAFYMVGGIEEVIDKAEKLSKDNK